MKKLNGLQALLRHDVQMLYSAEEQLIEAMPQMIEKASNPTLKKALEDHLHVTEKQLERLVVMQDILCEKAGVEDGEADLCTSFKDGIKCNGMSGLIEDGQRILAADLSPEMMDVAIIGGSQKIEHFEIASYCTEKTFAEQLGIDNISELLEQTLHEEYDADDRLTALLFLSWTGVNADFIWHTCFEDLSKPGRRDGYAGPLYFKVPNYK